MAKSEGNIGFLLPPVGELQKVKLEKKFQIVTGFHGLSTSTWHNLRLAALQVLAAVIRRRR